MKIPNKEFQINMELRKKDKSVSVFIKSIKPNDANKSYKKQVTIFVSDESCLLSNNLIESLEYSGTINFLINKEFGESLIADYHFDDVKLKELISKNKQNNF